VEEWQDRISDREFRVSRFTQTEDSTILDTAPPGLQYSRPYPAALLGTSRKCKDRVRSSVPDGLCAHEDSRGGSCGARVLFLVGKGVQDDLEFDIDRVGAVLFWDADTHIATR